MVRIALIGDFDPAVTAHNAIPKALSLSAQAAGCAVEPIWIATDRVSATPLDSFDAVWCVPASPYRDMDGALTAIRFARKSGHPFLGTCGGCQHAIIEFARNVAGITHADHEESNPAGADLLISKLACSLIEAEEDIRVAPGTRLSEIYSAPEIRERYRCRFGLNAQYRDALMRAGLRFGAFVNEEVRAIEIHEHPFFIAVLFQPERSGLRGEVHPLITAFVNAARARTCGAIG